MSCAVHLMRGTRPKPRAEAWGNQVSLKPRRLSGGGRGFVALEFFRRDLDAFRRGGVRHKRFTPVRNATTTEAMSSEVEAVGDCAA